MSPVHTTISVRITQAAIFRIRLNMYACRYDSRHFRGARIAARDLRDRAARGFPRIRRSISSHRFIPFILIFFFSSFYYFYFVALQSRGFLRPDQCLASRPLSDLFICLFILFSHPSPVLPFCTFRQPDDARWFAGKKMIRGHVVAPRQRIIADFQCEDSGSAGGRGSEELK